MPNVIRDLKLTPYVIGVHEIGIREGESLSSIVFCLPLQIRFLSMKEWNTDLASKRGSEHCYTCPK